MDDFEALHTVEGQREQYSALMDRYENINHQRWWAIAKQEPEVRDRLTNNLTELREQLVSIAYDLMFNDNWTESDSHEWILFMGFE